MRAASVELSLGLLYGVAHGRVNNGNRSGIRPGKVETCSGAVPEKRLPEPLRWRKMGPEARAVGRAYVP